MEQENRPNRFSLSQSNLGLFLYSVISIAVVIIVAIITVFVFIINIASGSTAENTMSKFSDNAILVSMASQLVVYLIIFAILILVFSNKVNLKEALFLKGFDFVTLLLTIATAFIALVSANIFGIFIDFIFSLLGIQTVIPPGLKELFEGPEWLTIFSVCIMAPLFEEFFFRGVIFSGYSKRYGTIKAALFTGLLFALIHGYIPSVIAIIPVGFIFGLLVGYSNSLYLTIIAHAVYNALALTNISDDLVMLPNKFISGAVGDIAQVVWMLILLPLCGLLIYYIIKEVKRRTGKRTSNEQIFEPDLTHKKSASATVFFVLASCLLGFNSILTNIMAYAG